ncbi:MAG TPA: hypothetical protein PKB02_04395 [Anaerohalosphaeraceae bacterium]|nr:hypothetical protein [Anaerohalosphaeraceae bacterium]
MQDRLTRKLVTGCVFSLIGTLCYAADPVWPTWRGPGMNGISPDGNPPIKWSETENILWKVKLEGDPSDGSPVISGDKIIFQSAVDTGKKSDAAPAAEPAPQSAPGGRPGRGPARAPSSIYQFNVVCLDRNTGKEIWKTTVCEVVITATTDSHPILRSPTASESGRISVRAGCIASIWMARYSGNRS